MTRPLIHPSLMTRLTPSFLPTSGTVQVGTEAQSSTGYPAMSWATLAGHAGIRCAVWPVDASERREAQRVYAEATHVALLDAVYASILPKHRFLVGSTAYEIVGVDVDSQSVATRLHLRLVTN